MLRQSAVANLVHIVEHKVQKVETRDERRWQVDVARDGPFTNVFGANGVGGGQNGCAGIQCGDDSGLSDGYCLLFLQWRVCQML
jgi:hypothetical protein